MSKLISTPIECAYKKPLFTRLGLPLYIQCLKNKNIVCNDAKAFPTNCPLPDGMRIISNKEFRDIFKPKRRNRKDCIHHIAKYDMFGRCKKGVGGNYLCKGVNCGCFKPKTK